MKKASLGFVAIALIVMLSLTQVQVQAQGISPQLDHLSGNRAGISGWLGISDIDSNKLVEISCQIGSSNGMGATIPLERSYGPGWRPFFCPFTGGGYVGASYYWVVVYAVYSDPCNLPNCATDYLTSHPLMLVSSPILIT